MSIFDMLEIQNSVSYNTFVFGWILVCGLPQLFQGAVAVGSNVNSDVTNDMCRTGPPNIIFMMADDAGWNDFSFHGSPQIPTPNIDALGLSGMILNNYYASPLCTPTRGAVMTGKHPIHLRLQHFVVMGGSAEGLPLTEKILPEYLKEVGYSTHLVGKWHLGHSRIAYTPTKRGFDSHFGYWLGKQDYYDHFSNDGGKFGYDFRSNLTVNYDVMGKYDTELFTEEAVRLINQQPKDKPMFLMINHVAPHSANGDSNDPLQAPIETIEKFNLTIMDDRRRKYAAMVDKLDESVGKVVSALAQSNLLQNSIIVFASDNGAAPDGFDLNYGSNWPLRGVKNTLWEGGTRLSALIWSPFIQNRVSYDLLRAEDWLPTIYEAIGCNPAKFFNIDGVSLWKTFTQGLPSPRTELLYNIDDIYNNSAIRQNEWKLIQGNTSSFDLALGGIWDGWYGPTGRSVDEDSFHSTVHDLIPKIKSSLAGEALISAGFRFNDSKLLDMQRKAEVLCPASMEQRQIPCNPYNRPCLFNLDSDPCEQRNVAESNPDIVQRLLGLLAAQNATALSPMVRFRDPRSDPNHWGNVWTTWLDNIESGKNPDFPNVCGGSRSDVFINVSDKIFIFVTILLWMRTAFY